MFGKAKVVLQTPKMLRNQEDDYIELQALYELQRGPRLVAV